MTLTLVPPLTELDPPTPADRAAAPPSAAYQPGDVLTYSWGYEQTNIDYFLVTKRTTSPKGVVNLTLVAMTSLPASTGSEAWSCGHVIPGVVKPDAKPFRRKLYVHEGRETGCAIRSYGWASSWDGKPDYYTGYA